MPSSSHHPFASTSSCRSSSSDMRQPWPTQLAISASTSRPMGPTSAPPRFSRLNPTDLPSEVIPRLYISDLSTAESSTALRKMGITHVLSTMSGYVAIPTDVPVARAQVPLEDMPFAELAAHLPVTTAFLRDALSNPCTRVLVHCAQGVSRSVSVVAAFLISQYGWSPAEAIQYIQTKRRIAEPNPGFVGQLLEYAERLRCRSF